MAFRAGQFAANGTMTVERIPAGVESRRQETTLAFRTQPGIAVQGWMR